MATKKKQAKPGMPSAAPVAPIRVSWRLDELPSSQHKTGLAGLVLMLRWLSDKPKTARRGVLRLVSVDASAATVEFDLEGLSWLMDETYAAEFVEVERDAQWQGTKPLRIIERKVETKQLDKKTGKPVVKLQKKFVYRIVQPSGAMLLDADPDGGGAWIKLWRDLVWGVLRAVPATRKPFNLRAEEEEADDALEIWAAFQRSSPSSVELPSTYFVGAQAATAENVGFRDLERFQFLLHFWPFAVGIGVPVSIDREGKSTFVGHVLSFADIADLAAFCDELRHVLDHRNQEVAAYLPKQAVLDLPAEGGLQFLSALRQRLVANEGKRSTADFVLGIDVFHLERDGNNVRTRSTVRVAPSDELQDEYERIKSSCRDPVFRRQLLTNLLSGREWSAGFERLFATLPSEFFLRGRREEGRYPSQFPADALREFAHHNPAAQKEASDV